MAAAQAGSALVCRVGALLCALPADMVVETMRLLPIDPLPGVPAFVAGTAIIRGSPLPVIILSRLLEAEMGPPSRMVVVRTAERRVALAIDELIGFRELTHDLVATLPPLLSGAANAAVTELATLDGALTAVMDTARLLPEDLLASLDRGGVAA